MERKSESWVVYAKRSRVPVQGKLMLDYYLSIGPHSRKLISESDFFITTPKIRSGISAITRKPGIGNFLRDLGMLRIGHIEVSKAQGEKTFHVDAYYPTHSLEMQFGKDFSERLAKAGLASLAELQIIKRLEKEFPGHKIILGKEKDSKERLGQLRRRGEKIGAETTLAGAGARLRAYVIRKGGGKMRGMHPRPR
ncbi:MAG: hypothetical protein WC602_00980 [archaeon]